MIPPSQRALRLGGTAALALLACWPLHASDAVLDAMQQELDRSVETLSGQPTPLYFLSYEITEERTSYARASFGALAGRSDSSATAARIFGAIGAY